MILMLGKRLVVINRPSGRQEIGKGAAVVGIYGDIGDIIEWHQTSGHRCGRVRSGT